MSMKWFGVSWGAPMNEECENAPPPVGEKCIHCDEGIVAADSGVIYANGPVAHRNCFIRGVSGSLAHILHHCSCYVPGSECGDPPNMTRRQAADEVARFLGYPSDDLMCDFCAARGELVLDVTAKKRVFGRFKSGNVMRDDGEWGACGECAQLINARNWHGLMERAIAGTDALFPDLAFDLDQRNRMKDMIEAVFGVKL